MALSTSQKIAILALCAASTTGCSLLFASSPPGRIVAPNYPVDCSTSRLAPIADTACAALTAALAANELRRSSTGDASVERSGGAGSTWVLLPIAAGCGVSAFVGWRSTAQCRSVKAVNDRCIGGDLGACHELVPGWVPPGAGPGSAPRAGTTGQGATEGGAAPPPPAAGPEPR